VHTVIPEQVGMSSARLARIDGAMQRFVDRGQLAGLVTLAARRGGIVHCQAVGLADLASGRPMQSDAIFLLWSMSKPVTAAAMLTLYEEGHFLLDDPVSRFVPGFKDMRVAVIEPGKGLRLVPLEREVTIRHLLTHTSGLCYGGHAPSPNDPLEDMYYHAGVWEADTLEEFARRVASAPLAFQPGTSWRYGMNLELVGALIAQISGMPLDAFMQERIFGPLGMEDTGFVVPASKLERLATTYSRDAKGALVPAPAPERTPGVDYRPYGSRQRFCSGGGGLVTTAPDFARFAQMLLNGGALDGQRILGRKAVEMMSMNYLPADRLPFVPPDWPFRTGYGMGLGVRVVVDVAQTGALGSVGSYTWQGAGGPDFWVDPKEELIGISLPQILPGDYRAAQEFRVLVYQSLAD
jgi:CubicO group peptidase (beta-lactamase class C family)